MPKESAPRVLERQADAPRLGAVVQEGFEISLEMRPAQLPPQVMDEAVRRPSVGHKATAEGCTQKLLGGVAVAASSNQEHGQGHRRGDPQPRCLLCFAPAGFVGVRDRRLFELFMRLGYGGLDRVTDPLFGVADGAE